MDVTYAVHKGNFKPTRKCWEEKALWPSYSGVFTWWQVGRRRDIKKDFLTSQRKPALALRFRTFLGKAVQTHRQMACIREVGPWASASLFGAGRLLNYWRWYTGRVCNVQQDHGMFRWVSLGVCVSFPVFSACELIHGFLTPETLVQTALRTSQIPAHYAPLAMRCRSAECNSIRVFQQPSHRRCGFSGVPRGCHVAGEKPVAQTTVQGSV